MKAAASGDLATALAASAPARAARQGADPRPGNGSPDTASFDSVLTDVQGSAGIGPAGNGNLADPATEAEPAANPEPATDNESNATPGRPELQGAGRPANQASGRLTESASDWVPANAGFPEAASTAVGERTPDVPVRDGDLTGASAAGAAAKPTTAADDEADSAPSAAGSAPSDAASPAVAGFAWPAQYASAQWAPAQFVAFAQPGQPAPVGPPAQPGQAAQAVASDGHGSPRAAAPAFPAPAAAGPAGVPAAAAEGTAVPAAPGMPDARLQMPGAIPVRPVAGGDSSAVAAAQIAGAVPSSGPTAATGGSAGAASAAPVPALAAAPEPGVAALAASPATGAAGAASAAGPASVLTGSPAGAVSATAEATTLPREAAAATAQAKAPTKATAGESAQTGPGRSAVLGSSTPVNPAASPPVAMAGAPLSGRGEAAAVATVRATAVAPSAAGQSAITSAGSTAAGNVLGSRVAPAAAVVPPGSLTDPAQAKAQAPRTAEALTDQVSGGPAGAVAVPVQSLTAGTTMPQPAAQAAAQPPSQPAPQPAEPLQPQLAKPLFTLVGAPRGEHIMTLKVSPEDLGPLTVRAQIDAAGVRIELFAPGEAGREAVRGILPELRKELADAGFGASLDLSDHSGPMGLGQNGGQNGGQHGTAQDRAGTQYAAGRESGGGGNGSGPSGRNDPAEQRPGHRWDALADGQAVRAARILNGPQTTLDILV
ncbi:flagellar hook-length control protein FliK [Arthrobacter sp. TE12231]